MYLYVHTGGNMPDQEDVDNQVELLKIHRQTLSYALRQIAMMGGTAYAPVSLVHTTSEARSAIAKIKNSLRAWEIPIEDLPDDEDWETRSSSTPALNASEASSRVDDDERQQLREVLRAHQRRLRVLEIQEATKGINTPPEIITEIEDVRSEIRTTEMRLRQLTPPTDRATQRQRRSDALAAFYRKDWERAEELLEQVLEANPGDAEMEKKLQQVQRELELRAAYNALRRLRDDGMWEALLNALDDLALEYPNAITAPDMNEMRAWAEYRKQRAARYASVVDTLEAVIAVDPGDEDARAMLTQALAARDAGR